MSISPILADPSFVDRTPALITADLVSRFEAALGKTLYPAQVERVLLDMLAYRETLLRIAIQEAAKQNPTYARAPMLDHLGGLTGAIRLPAQKSRVYVLFTIPVQAVTVTITAGTEIRNADGSIVFATAADCAIIAGQTFVSTWADALIPGAAMNGLAAGQLSVLPSPPVLGAVAVNTSVSYGGSAVEDDEHFRRRVLLAPERDACGTWSAYRLATLSTHPDIVDVAVTSDAPGAVTVSAATATGAPDEGLLALLRVVLNDEAFKPLTDSVTVIAPTAVPFAVDLRLSVYQGASPAAGVQEAVEAFVAILRKTLGKALIPSQFAALAQGIPGVQAVVVMSPVKTSLTAHQYADCAAIAVTVTEVVHG